MELWLVMEIVIHVMVWENVFPMLQIVARVVVDVQATLIVEVGEGVVVGNR